MGRRHTEGGSASDGEVGGMVDEREGGGGGRTGPACRYDGWEIRNVDRLAQGNGIMIKVWDTWEVAKDAVQEAEESGCGAGCEDEEFCEEVDWERS